MVEEVSPGRKLRTYGSIAVGVVVLAMILANHVVRGRSVTVLDVVFYCVLLGFALAVFDKDVFKTVSREGRMYWPGAKMTQTGQVIPKDLPPPPPRKSQP